MYFVFQGDSGGPLMCRGADDRWHLLGVTSFGPAGYCAQERVGVFARVSQFYEWIDGQINGPNALNGKCFTLIKSGAQ